MINIQYGGVYWFLILLMACNEQNGNAEQTVQELEQTVPYRVMKTHPHNTDFFTQGLFFDKGLIYEGTGLYDKSGIFVYDLMSGKIIRQIKLNNKYFGEGIAPFGEYLYQLTWQNHECLVYDKKSLKKIKTLPLKSEGWGLTQDGKHLIVSDGTDNLYFYNPTTWTIEKTLRVNDKNGPVGMLNELEFVDGYIYANKWFTNKILIIDSLDGKVKASVDFQDLVKTFKSELSNNSDAVLNGIAYVPETKRFLITGKLWSKIFEIEIGFSKK